MQRRWRRGAYVLYLALVTVVGLEILLRLFATVPDYAWKFRFLYTSPNSFENFGASLWTYRPHTAVREVAVYALPQLIPFGMRMHVEYDCRMRTNNLGLLQETDVAPGTEATVIVGDSFTSGQGGCPWFDRLQALRPGEQLVNGGLMGTGFAGWKLLVDHLRSRGIKVKRLLLIAISDDVRRIASGWGAQEFACLDQGACAQITLWQPVAHDESHNSLTARSEQRLAMRFPRAMAFEVVKGWLQRHSFVFKYGNRANEAVKALIRSARRGGERDTGLEGTEAALDALKSSGIPLQVLLVPQRSETGLLAPRADLDRLVALLDTRKLPHSFCPLTGADFLQNDGHPSREGYDKVVACAHKALEAMRE